MVLLLLLAELFAFRLIDVICILLGNADSGIVALIDDRPLQLCNGHQTFPIFNSTMMLWCQNTFFYVLLDHWNSFVNQAGRVRSLGTKEPL